jgi:hypothetical protein
MLEITDYEFSNYVLFVHLILVSVFRAHYASRVYVFSLILRLYVLEGVTVKHAVFLNVTLCNMVTITTISE